jgi:outer membrane receptor for ferrienterochelin and colicin
LKSKLLILNLSKKIGIFLFLLTTIGGYSQPISSSQIPIENVVKGTVIDRESQLPVSFANILVLPDSFGVYSNMDGSFLITNINAEGKSIQISCIGYETYFLDFNQSESSKNLEILLNPKAILSEEIIISSSKKLQSIALSPASIEVLSKDEIESKSISTFDQLLDQANGIQVTRSSGSNVQAVSIRGSSEVAGGGIGNRVLLLIDGRPALSPESGGALWNMVPVNSIEKVEVLKGAYSSLYGSSAVGGVINVITKKPTKGLKISGMAKMGMYNSAPVSSEYEENGKFYQIGAGLSNKKGNLGYILDATVQSNGGHREKSSFDMTNIYGKLDWGMGSTRHIQVSGNINSIFNDTPASWLSRRLAYSVAEYKKDDYQKKKEYSFDINYSSIPNASTKYNTKLYYYSNYSEFNFNDDPQNDSTNVNFGKQTVDFETLSANRIGLLNQIDYFKNKHYLICGIELQYDQTNGTPDTVLYGKHNSFSGGIYFQDEITLNSQLTLTAGVRYDYFNIINEYSESNLSPKLALVYRPTKKLSLRALYARAFRNPSIAERFIKFEQGGGLRFMPNSNLVAEKLNLSLETGALLKLSDHISIDAALYFNRYKDLISFVQRSQPGEALVFQVINLKEAEIKGFEISSNFKVFEKLKIKLSYNYLDAKDISEDRFNDQLAYKIKHNLNYSLLVPIDKFNVSIYGKYRSAVEEVFIYPGSEPEAYFLHNLKISYRFSNQFSGSFSLNNLTNTKYEELERYRMAGRNYSLALKLNLE